MRKARRSSPAATTDPTTDAALRALDVHYTRPPDIPVDVAKKEFASLARLAKSQAATFSRIGVSGEQIETMARFALRLAALEKAWQKARAGVKLSPKERKQLAEAEKLDAKLVAGGRWGCRNDEEALTVLQRIAEGSGLTDTVQDLKDLVTFWGEHETERAVTDVTDKDVARATELAEALGPAAEKEANDVAAANALEPPG